MNTTERMYSDVLKEFEQALLKATPAEIEALLIGMDDKERIEAGLEKCSAGW